MNTARVVVLAIAVSAGGVAAFLASGSDRKPVAQVAAPVPQLETTDVLVAKNDIPLGQTLAADDMKWQSWPAAAASASFIKKSEHADAMKDMTGSIVRSPYPGRRADP